MMGICAVPDLPQGQAGGGVVDQNLGINMPPGLSKIGFQELIFLGLKLGSPEQIFAKICVSGAKIQQKLVSKCKIFFKKSKWGLQSGKKA